MHAPGILLFAGLAVCFTCSGQQKLERKLPAHIRLSDGFALGARSHAVTGKKPGAVNWAALPAPGTSCAHIIVKPVTPEIDPKIIINMPEGHVSHMPIFKGLPACQSVHDDR